MTPSASDHSPAAVLRISNVSKEYRLYDSPRARLQTLLTGEGAYRSQKALQNVSFSLPRGQCMGVVGSNGAGKSTLLKLVTGTIRPTSGTVSVDGRITAILELGAGFHPDFTGRQNLHFSGSLIGLSAEQLHTLEPEILAFSELGEAIDRPVRTYSSGMTVRLGFALVTAVQPDVLIVDEALAVGDMRFQKKCIDRIQAFRDAGCSILFCSHSNYHVRQLCDVALWLDKGQQRMFGPTEDVLVAYEQHLRQLDQEVSGTPASLAPTAPDSPDVTPADFRHAASDKAEIVEFRIDSLDESSEPPLLQSPDLRVHVTVQMPPDEVPSIGVMIEQHHGVGITSVATHWENTQPHALGNGLWRATLCYPDISLHTGEYVLSAYLFDASGLLVYDQWFQHKIIRLHYAHSRPGIVQLPHTWEA